MYVIHLWKVLGYCLFLANSQGRADCVFVERLHLDRWLALFNWKLLPLPGAINTSKWVFVEPGKVIHDACVILWSPKTNCWFVFLNTSPVLRAPNELNQQTIRFTNSGVMGVQGSNYGAGQEDEACMWTPQTPSPRLFDPWQCISFLSVNHIPLLWHRELKLPFYRWGRWGFREVWRCVSLRVVRSTWMWVLAAMALASHQRVWLLESHTWLGWGHTHHLWHRYKLLRTHLNTGLNATSHDSTYRSDLLAEANLFI